MTCQLIIGPGKKLTGFSVSLNDASTLYVKHTGDLLRRIRESAKFGYLDMSRLLGCEVADVKSWEKGRVQDGWNQERHSHVLKYLQATNFEAIKITVNRE